MRTYRLPKRCKLCAKTAVEKLFERDAEGVSGCIAYPLRAVWRVDNERPRGDMMQFMVTVPKKKLRHAVDRVTMRRRVREAYRLNRHSCDVLTEQHDVAFVYLANSLMPYSVIEKSMIKILDKIKAGRAKEDERD
ncbi:MAG: ribonuclease P protein component [Clostridiales bacterium]|nr:ribonuclease P protein component [Clostridiales bacterium]